MTDLAAAQISASRRFSSTAQHDRSFTHNTFLCLCGNCIDSTPSHVCLLSACRTCSKESPRMLRGGGDSLAAQSLARLRS